MTAGAEAAPALARPELRARERLRGGSRQRFRILRLYGLRHFPRPDWPGVLSVRQCPGERSGVGRRLRRRLCRETPRRRPHRRLWRPGGPEAGDDPLHRIDGGRQLHHRVHARLPDDWRPVAPMLLIIARLLQGFAVGGEVGPATMFLLEAAPPDRRMFYASWQIASQNFSSLFGGLMGLLLALALSQSRLQRLGLAGSLRVWRPDSPGRHILFASSSWRLSKSRRRDRVRGTRPRFSLLSFALTGEDCCSVSPSSAGARSPSISSSL